MAKKQKLSALKNFARHALIFFGKYVLPLYMVAVTGNLAKKHVLAAIKTPDNYDDFQIAENINQYFNYLSQEKIDRTSEVDRIIPLQNALLAKGYDLGQCGADGIYGNKTESAVRSYQMINSLPVTGVADTKTLQNLTDAISSNTVLEAQLDTLLLEPYRNSEHQELVENLPEIMQTTVWSLVLRPDVMGISLYELVANDFRDDAASLAFSGCESNHVRDGFRHTQSMFNIAKNSLFSGEEWAVKVGDMRERYSFSTLPLLLMDSFNNRVAVEIYSEHKVQNLKIGDPVSVFKQEIDNGRFAVYPFPLVPKGS